MDEEEEEEEEEESFEEPDQFEVLRMFTRPGDATPEDAEYYCYSGDSCPSCQCCDLAFDDLCCHNCGWAPLHDSLLKSVPLELPTSNPKPPVVIDLTEEQDIKPRSKLSDYQPLPPPVKQDVQYAWEVKVLWNTKAHKVAHEENYLFTTREIAYNFYNSTGLARFEVQDFMETQPVTCYAPVGVPQHFYEIDPGYIPYCQFDLALEEFFDFSKKLKW